MLSAFAAPSLPLQLLRGPAFGILPALYAQRFGISLASIAGVLLLLRVIDGVTDVAVGYGTDRTQNGVFGRKAWMLVGAALTAGSLFMLYVPPEGATLVYLSVWFFLAYLAWTLLEVPYGAWGTELTRDYRERSRIAVARQVFTIGGSAMMVIVPLLPFLPTKRITFETLHVIAWLVAFILPVSVLIAIRVVPRGESLQRRESHSLRELWASARESPALLRYLAAYAATEFGVGAFGALAFIYIDSYLRIGEYIAAAYAISIVGGWVGLALWSRSLRIREKHRVWAVAGLAAAGCHLLNAFLTPEIGLAFFAISLVFQLFAMASEAVPLAIVGDLVDHNLLRRGANRAGQYAALAMAVRKGSLGFGAAAALAITGAFAFTPGQAQYDAGPTVGLKLAFVVLPALSFLVSALLMWNFPLDSRRQAIVRRRITDNAARERRGADHGRL
jgi:GPH family glycoside/pentoside/hexuronide:cation symporter